MARRRNLNYYQFASAWPHCYGSTGCPLGKTSAAMSRTSCFALCLMLLASTEVAHARGGSSRDCKVPRIGLCPGCTINVKITVLQDHECHINYGSLGPMHPQKILVGPKHGTYSAPNETTTSYSPGKGFLGSDYFETRFEYELMNGSLASAVLKAEVEVVPNF
jgi:hypothetical protein